MANFFHALLFLIFFIAVHVHARESQFFSKFTANSDSKTETDEATTWVGPSKEQVESLEKQTQDPSSFVAETQNGYGLDGHETGQFPPSDAAVTTAAATTTSFADEPYYNKDMFATEDEFAGDTKAMRQGSSFKTTDAATKDSYDGAAVNGQNNYFSAEEQRSRYMTGAATGVNYGNVVANGRNNYYSVGNRYMPNNNEVRQQQGISDTRFLDNGKYYYNVDDEEKYNPTRYVDSRNKEFGSQQVYFPSNDVNSYEYSNKGNYHAADNGNAMTGGYEPVKDMEEFRGTRNVDEEFMP